MCESGGASSFPWKRVCVIGASGSGKTTFARAMAEATGLPHIELDALHWRDNWTETDRETMRGLVAEAVTAEQWIIDGNYRSHRDLLWRRADLIVWLDLPRLTVHGGVLRRTIGRVVLRSALWNTNNRESLRRMLSRESVVLWSLQTYRSRRADAAADLKEPRFAHLECARLRSRSEAKRWLQNIGTAASNDDRMRHGLT